MLVTAAGLLAAQPGGWTGAPSGDGGAAVPNAWLLLSDAAFAGLLPGYAFAQSVTQTLSLTAADNIGDGGTLELDGPRGIAVFESDGSTYAAVTVHDDNRVQILNVTDPSNVTAAGSIAHGGAINLDDPFGIATFTSGSSTYAAVAAFEGDGVQILDITDPSAITAAGNITNTDDLELDGAWDIATFTSGSSTYAAVAAFRDDGVQILDITDPSNVTETDSIAHGGAINLDGAWDIATFTSGSSTYAAVTASMGDGGVQILDITDPSAITAAGNITDTPSLELDGANGIAVFESGGSTYAAVAAAADDGVQILDITDPSAITAAGNITDTPALELRGASGIAVFESGGSTYAAVAAYDDDSVQILDITDPSAITAAGNITDTPALELYGAENIATFTSGGSTYAAVAAYDDDGVQILRLTNSPPTVEAGPDQTVDEGDTVTLSGTASDSDNDPLTYMWTHDSALSITLADDTALSTTFTAPAVTQDTTVTFTLAVSDATDSITDMVSVTITNNSPPTVNAGPDQTVDEGDTVTLSGTASDSDNDPLTHMWTHNRPGLGITLADDAALSTTFTAPAVTQDTTVTFTLAVSDGTDSVTDMVSVTITDSPGLTPTAADSIADAGALKLFGPRYIATFTSGGSTYAAVAAFDDSGVQILDITDPFNVTATDNIGDTTTLKLADAEGIAVFESGDSTYAAVTAYGEDGVQILDVTDPYNVTAAGNIANNSTLELFGPRGITTFTSGGSTYAAVAAFDDNGVQILDITDPYNVTAAGNIANNSTLELSGAWDIATFTSGGGTYAAVASSDDDGVQILNVTDPSAVTAAGSIANNSTLKLDAARGITTFTSGGSTYAAVTALLDDGVQILDVTDPSAITAAGSINGTGTPALDGALGIATFTSGGSTYAAVAASIGSGVQILNVTDPYDITAAGSITDTDATALELEGAGRIATFTSGGSTYAAVASYLDDGVQILRLASGVPPPAANNPPTVNAGPDQTVDEGDTVTLSGTASDSDNDPLTYMWTHDSALPISLADDTALSTTFTAPAVTQDTTVTFTLAVSDATDSATDTVSVTITNNIPPTVNAGPDQTVDEGDTVTLSGTASDSDNDPLTYMWTHDSALPISLADDTALSTTFTAPAVTQDTTVTFTLAVSDDTDSVTDTLQVTITDSPGLTPTAADSIDDDDTLLLNGARSIAIFESGDSTYAAIAAFEDDGVQILDVTDPSAVTAAGSIANNGTLLLNSARGIAVFESGGSTYVAVTALSVDGVQILDVTDPSAVTAAGNIADNSTLLLDGALGITTFTSDGRTYAAVAAYTDDGVQILDVTVPSAITAAGSIANSGTLRLDGASGITTFESGGSTYAAVTSSLGTGGVQILDVTDPSAVTAAGSIGGTAAILLSGAEGITTFESDGRTYAAVASIIDDGVQILDVTVPSAITAAGSITDGGALELAGARGIATFTSGGSTYAAVAAVNDDGVQILDVTDPSAVTAVGSITDGGALELLGARGIATFTSGGDTYAAVAANADDGVQILRLTGPPAADAGPGLTAADSITDTGTLKLFNARGIATFESGGGTYAAVTGYLDYGVQILDVTNPYGITAAGSIADDAALELAGAWDVATFTSGDSTYAAVTAYFGDGVQILDVTDPSDITATDSIGDTETRELSGAFGIATFTSGSRTYAAVTALWDDDGVQILDVTDPYDIAAAGSIGDTRTLELSGASDVATFTSGGRTYAAVAAYWDDGVQILDVTNPSAVTAAGSIGDTAALELDGAHDIATFESGGRAYAAVAAYWDDGVQILDVTDPSAITAAGSITDDAALELDGAEGITVFESGGRTYAAVASVVDDGVQMLDITDPSDITAVGSITDDAALELLGASGIATFTSGGDTYAAVTAHFDSGVQILRLTGGGAILTASSQFVGEPDNAQGFAESGTVIPRLAIRDLSVQVAPDSPPTVTSIARSDPAGAATSERTLVFAVTFSEDVTGVDLGDFALSPDSTGGGSGPGQFTQTSEPATRIADRSTIQDAITVDRSGTATSVSVAVDISHTYRGDLVIDLIAPDGTSQTLHSRTGGSANDIDRTYAPDFDGTGIAGDWTLRVSDRAGGDVGTLNGWTLTIGHGTAGSPVTGLTGSGDAYLVTVSAAQDGTYNLDLVSSGHGITDSASNPLTDTVPTTGTDHTYTVGTAPADTTAPTLASIERSDPSGELTPASTLVFEVTFSEDVTGVDLSDFALSSGGTGTGSVTNLAGSGSRYLVTVSAAQDGTYNLDLVSSGHSITDAADNPLSSPAPTGADHTYTVSAIPADATAPTVTSIARSDPAGAATSERTLVFAVAFSEDVTGVDLSDFALSPDSTGGSSSSGQFTQTSEPATRIADRSTIQDAITVDRSGTATSVSVAVDISHTYRGDLVIVLIAPDGTSQTLHSRTGGSANDIDRTYTPDFDGTGIAGDWTLRVSDRAGGDVGTLNGWTLTIGHGTAGSPVTGLAGSGSQYLVTVSAAQDGTYNLDLVSSGHGITDSASNPLTNTAPTGTDHTYTVSATVTDSTAPTLASIERYSPADQNTDSQTLVYKVTFSEDVTGVDTGDFVLSQGSTGTGSTASLTGSGSVYYATVSAAQDGTYNLDLVSSGHGITDTAGNPLSSPAPTGADHTYTVSATPADATAPTVTSIERSDPAGATTSERTLVFAVTFSEDVTGVDLNDFALSPGSTGGGSSSGQFTQTSEPATRIADRSTIQDAITVDRSGTATSVSVAVDISHTYRGDLVIVLIAPDGTSQTLHSRTGGSANDIDRTYTPDFDGTGIAGDWTLRVSDRAGGDVGTLNGWTLTIGHGGAGSPVTGLAGSGDAYLVTVSAAQDGTYNLDLVSSGHGITDTAGNPLSSPTPTGADHTYTVGAIPADTTAPAVTSIVRSNPAEATTSGRTLVFAVTFSEDVTGVDLSDFALSSGGTGTGSVTNLAGSGSQYLVTVSAAQDGTYNLDLVPSGHGITDSASNPLSSPAPTGADHTYTVHTPPIQSDTINTPPSISAGPDQTVQGGQVVSLTGTATDVDGDPLTYSWSHDSALAIEFANSTAPSTTFTAPQVSSNTTFILTLTVDDGTQAASDSMGITIVETPEPPRDIGEITLTSTGPGVIEASWEAPTETPADYRIAWAKVGEPYLTWTDLSGNAFPTSPSQTVTGLEEGEQYKVKVRARYSSGGPGDWSGEFNVTVAGTG